MPEKCVFLPDTHTTTATINYIIFYFLLYKPTKKFMYSFWFLDNHIYSSNTFLLRLYLPSLWIIFLKVVRGRIFYLFYTISFLFHPWCLWTMGKKILLVKSRHRISNVLPPLKFCNSIAIFFPLILFFLLFNLKRTFTSARSKSILYVILRIT